MLTYQNETCFSKLDKTIELQTQKLEQLNKLKKDIYKRCSLKM